MPTVIQTSRPAECSQGRNSAQKSVEIQPSPLNGDLLYRVDLKIKSV